MMSTLVITFPVMHEAVRLQLIHLSADDQKYIRIISEH